MLWASVCPSVCLHKSILCQNGKTQDHGNKARDSLDFSFLMPKILVKFGWRHTKRVYQMQVEQVKMGDFRAI